MVESFDEVINDIDVFNQSSVCIGLYKLIKYIFKNHYYN